MLATKSRALRKRMPFTSQCGQKVKGNNTQRNVRKQNTARYQTTTVVPEGMFSLIHLAFSMARRTQPMDTA